MPVETLIRRCRAFVIASVVGVVITGIVLAPPADAEVHLEQYIEVPQCPPPAAQLCGVSPQVNFTAGQNDRIQASFTGNANGCSDALVRFNVDDYPQSDWLRVGPNQTVSATFDRSGEHVLSVTAKGIEGGCNTGSLNSWGGMVRIDSVDLVGPAPRQIPEPVGPAPRVVPATPCKWGYTGGVLIEQDNGIRVDLDQWRGLTALGPAHLYARLDAPVESNRGVVIGASGQGTHVDFSIVWFDKRGGRAEGNDYTGDIDPQFGTLRGTTVNDAGVRNEWVAREFFECK